MQRQLTLFSVIVVAGTSGVCWRQICLIKAEASSIFCFSHQLTYLLSVKGVQGCEMCRRVQWHNERQQHNDWCCCWWWWWCQQWWLAETNEGTTRRPHPRIPRGGCTWRDRSYRRDTALYRTTNHRTCYHNGRVVAGQWGYQVLSTQLAHRFPVRSFVNLLHKRIRLTVSASRCNMPEFWQFCRCLNILWPLNFLSICCIRTKLLM